MQEGGLYKIMGHSLYDVGETLYLRIKRKEDMSGYWLVKAYELTPHREITSEN